MIEFFFVKYNNFRLLKIYTKYNDVIIKSVEKKIKIELLSYNQIIVKICQSWMNLNLFLFQNVQLSFS